jgi:hypothetical protein
MFHIRTLCESDSASRTVALHLRCTEALVHFLPGPEERDGFLLDHHNGAGGRVAAGIGASLARRKYSEAAEFDPVSPAQRGRRARGPGGLRIRACKAGPRGLDITGLITRRGAE